MINLISSELIFSQCILLRRLLLGASFTHLRHVLQGSTFQTQDLSSLLKGFHKDNVKDASYKEFMETLRILLSGLKVI